MRTLSSILIGSLKSNMKANVLAKKMNNKWEWSSRGDLLSNITYCRKVLQSQDIKRGDRIAYKGDNSMEWIAWNLACNSLGAVWVPMYTNQSNEYCKHVVNDSGATLCIMENMDEPYTDTKILSNTVGDTSIYTEKIDFIENDIATLIYTSGTTGSPKGVMLSNENIISNIETTRSRFKDMYTTTSLNILPWAHIYSQTCELYYNLKYNNKMALASSRENFISECREIQPEVLYVVPRILELIKSKIDILDIPYVRYLIPFALHRIFGQRLQVIFTGGAKLQDKTRQFFANNDIVICEGYGTTELSPMVCVNHMNDPRNEESIGKVLDNIIVEIVEGEIQVSGPNVMSGYWNNEDATRKVLVEREGKTWYKTGDAGRIEDGYIFYEGRISDNYKLSSGKFVNVDSVENVVKRFVKGMVVVFGEDKDYNELITDQIVHTDTLREINKSLQNYLKIKKIHYLDTDEWSPYLTPKMSVKRKLLIQEKYS